MKAIKKITFTSIFFLLIIHCNCVKANGEEYIDNSYITQDTVWDGTKIIDGKQVILNSNVTLTINAGSTLILSNAGSIIINGKLKIIGEANKKVHILSESNPNNNYSLNYYLYSNPGSEIEMSNFILENGGGNKGTASFPALTIKGKANLSKGIVRRNRVSAITNWSSDTIVNDCEIYDQENLSIENKASNSINFQNNWWGNDDGPSQNGEAYRERIKGNISFSPWQKKGPIPIIIVPGFGGSFSFKLLKSDSKDDWTMTPIGTSSYKYIEKALTLAGYEKDKNLFWSFYDWRLPCEKSSEQFLQEKIEEAKTRTGHFQVYILSHSMGGLVARNYTESNNYRDDICRIITIGTPHLGASEVFPLWNSAIFPEKNKYLVLYLWYLKIINKEWNSVNFIKKNFPSLKQMIPIYDFLINKNNDSLITYSDGKEKNDFLEDLNSNIKLLKRRVSISTVSGTGKETQDKIRIEPDSYELAQNYSVNSFDGDGTVLEKSSNANNVLSLENLSMNGSHSEIFKDSRSFIYSQFKIRSNPAIPIDPNYFIVSVVGPVSLEIRDANNKKLNSEISEISGGKYIASNLDDSKLILAFIPNPSKQARYKIYLSAQNDGPVNIAFWNVSGKDDTYEKIGDVQQIMNGVDLIYSAYLDNSQSDNPKISIEDTDWQKLLKIISPLNNSTHLNWKYISSETAFLKDVNERKDLKYQTYIDNQPENNSIDLSKYSIGKHKLNIQASWNENNKEKQDENEIDINIDTTSKSLIALINRLYKDKEIFNWKIRSNILDNLSQAYQDITNNRTAEATNKLQEIKDILETEKDSINVDRVRILENSISSLKRKPR